MLLALLLACAPSPDRLVVLGMDGLERRLVERLVAEGELPHFREMIEQGSMNDLHVPKPVLSPIIWTTIASGYPGEVHGIGGWTSASGRPYTAADVRTWRLWDVASAHDVPVLVAGWMMTWPASPVPGGLVSDRLVWAFPMNKDPAESSVALSQQAHDDRFGLAWPPDLSQRAAGWIPEDADDPAIAVQLATYGGPFHPYTRDETQVRAFEHLWDETDARIAMVYLVGADQVSHLYWPFLEPEVQRTLREDPDARRRAAAADLASRTGRRAYPWSEQAITPAQVQEGAAWVPDYYRWLDSALGRVMDRVDPAHTTLIVCSDHGFQMSHANPVLNGSHRDTAVLLAWGARVKRAAAEEASVADLGVTLYALAGLPAASDMPGNVLGDLFDVSPAAPVPTWLLPRVRVNPSQTTGDAGRRLLDQLEALGYVDELGEPVLGASRGVGMPTRPPGQGAPD